MTASDLPSPAFVPPEDGAHLATRYRLMDVAARLMAHQGYAGTSLRAVASAAGVTTGAIYAHFPGGKRALFLEIIQSVVDAVQRFVADGMVGTTDPVDAIVRQAGGLWDFFDTYPSFAALITRENIRGALGDPSPFALHNADAIEQLRALLDHAVAAGQMRPVNVSYVLFWITTTCTSFHGCRPLRDAVFTPDDSAHARADFLAAVHRMLSPDGDPR